MAAADGLALFTRAPMLGAVKTRLAASIGAAEALGAHRVLVEGSLARLADDGRWCTELWVEGDLRHPEVVGWCRRHALVAMRQRGDDLGGRMRATLVDMLSRYRRAVLTGCDCPTIDASYVAAAFAALDECDVVIGPAEDGGYGLIGVSGRVPEVFTGVPWGSPEVLNATLDRARDLGASVRLLDEVWDVDDLAGWERYQAFVS